jgi:hypothetical protein
MFFFPACSTVIRGASRHATGASWLVPSTLRCSQTCRQCSQACRQLSLVLPDVLKVLSSSLKCSQMCHNHRHGPSVAVIGDSSYSEGQQVCPPKVWYSPEIDSSKFTLHILSDTPGVFQCLKYILLMCIQRLHILPSGLLIPSIFQAYIIANTKCIT